MPNFKSINKFEYLIRCGEQLIFLFCLGEKFDFTCEKNNETDIPASDFKLNFIYFYLTLFFLTKKI